MRVASLLLAVAVSCCVPGTANAQAVNSPSPQPSCATPYREVTATSGGIADYDPREIAPQMFTTRTTAIVEVTVSPTGSVSNAKLYKSSGIMVLDEASIAAVETMTFLPRIVGCNSVAATSLVRMNYDPPGYKCGYHYVPASILRAPKAVWPTGAHVTDPVIVQIAIAIDSNGNVVRESVHNSGESDLFDDAAVDLVSEVKFNPAEQDCDPVGSTGNYTVEFDPPGPLPSHTR